MKKRKQAKDVDISMSQNTAPVASTTWFFLQKDLDLLWRSFSVYYDYKFVI